MEIKSYFDILRVIGKPAYDGISNHDKERCFFMINRQLTRVYPVIAATLGQMKIDGAAATDFWHHHLKLIKSKGGNPMPSPMYAKLAAPKKPKKPKYSKDAIKYAMERFELSPKEFNLMMEFSSKELIKYLNSVDEMLNEKVKK